MVIWRSLSPRSCALCLGVIMSASLMWGCFLRADEPVRYVHADFRVTDELMLRSVATLPERIQRRILRVPQYFTELLFATLTDLPEESMQLVDKTHALPLDYMPPDLTSLSQYGEVLSLTVIDMQISERVIPDLLAMSAEAAHDGIVIPTSSAYRSYAYQEFIYNNSVEAFGQEETDRSVARAGHSQHQLGTAIDFGDISEGFGDTPAGQWLLQNGWRFGFSISYPRGQTEETGYKYESWHYRYIGRSAAQLERYFFESRQQLLIEYLERNRFALTDLFTPVEYGYR